VNVADQRNDPDSLLNFIRLLTARYRSCPELGWGRFEVLAQPRPEVAAHRLTWEDASLVAVHNLSPQAVTLTIGLPDAAAPCTLLDLLQDGVTALDENGEAEIELDGYGYRWLRVSRPGDRRLR
jgi:hypothetical protein